MDTPIRLKCTKMGLQKPFLGVIHEDVLEMVCKEDATCNFFCYALSMVLAHEFLRNEKRYCISIDITSYFLTSLLDLGGNQIDILMLLRNVFKEIFLEADVKILVLVKQVPGLGIGSLF